MSYVCDDECFYDVADDVYDFVYDDDDDDGCDGDDYAFAYDYAGDVDYGDCLHWIYEKNIFDLTLEKYLSYKTHSLHFLL